MAKGKVRGFTAEIKVICENQCGLYGDPPCYKLPDISSDADNTTLYPCDECREILAASKLNISARELENEDYTGTSTGRA